MNFSVVLEDFETHVQNMKRDAGRGFTIEYEVVPELMLHDRHFDFKIIYPRIQKMKIYLMSFGLTKIPKLCIK